MVYWYCGGMQTYLGKDKWKEPHGTYRDLGGAIARSWSLMFVFVAIMPLGAGALLLYGVEPAMGIEPGTANANWIEPIIVMIYLTVISLIVKWGMWPRKPWYSIPAT